MVFQEHLTVSPQGHGDMHDLTGHETIHGHSGTAEGCAVPLAYGRAARENGGVDAEGNR
jgi:hypothetical protein